MVVVVCWFFVVFRGMFKLGGRVFFMDGVKSLFRCEGGDFVCKLEKVFFGEGVILIIVVGG